MAVISRNPGVVLWHHCLDAPRAERERKAIRYALLDQSDPASHQKRLLYEDHPEFLQDIPPGLKG